MSIYRLPFRGPSSHILAPIADVDIENLGLYRFSFGRIFGIEAIVSRTGYTGEDGFEVYVRGTENEAKRIWRGLLDQGRAHGIVPVGLGARDTLRLEMGYCLYGNDISRIRRHSRPVSAGSQS